MKDENEQFFDGFLLGALIIGMIVVTLVTFFLFQDARRVGEGDMTLSERIVEVKPVNAVQRDETGQTVMIKDKEYRILHAFDDEEKNLTYRSLLDENDEVYASLWAQNGEQLLYAPEVPILDAMGSVRASIVSIKSDHELLLMSSAEELFVFDLNRGLVMPWKQ